MTTAKAVLDAARRWVGYKEGYNNDTVFGSRWGYPNQPWCGMFVESMVEEAGGSVGDNGTIPYTEYCPTGVSRFRARGAIVSTPQAGDIIYYWNGSEFYHVGLVEETSGWPYSITTIEGNTSSGVGVSGNGDGVYRRTRYPSSNTTFARPRYDAATPIPSVVFTINLADIYDGADNNSTLLVRTRLVQLGYGIAIEKPWGADAAYAYSAWQKKLGYSGADADGKPGPSSLTAMGFTVNQNASASWPVRLDHFSNGANNSSVILVRARLIQLGYGIPPKAPWDASAVFAYSLWQRRLGYSGGDADGVPGVSSLRALGFNVIH